MLEKYPEIMTVDQLAEALHICKNNAYLLLNTNEVGFKRVGRRIIIPKICVIDYLRSAQNKPFNADKPVI